MAEQIDFYRADAKPFDRWLAQLLDEDNDEPVARVYRAGRERVARTFEKLAPLGRVLEVAAGTGRLANLYAPHAESVLLLDASPESLAIAQLRLPNKTGLTLVEADIFGWDTPEGFDTIVFSAWLHHVPHSRFVSFWRKMEGLLNARGRVIFDFPDVNVSPPGHVDVPAEPSEEYGFYAPADGVSVRDRFGRRWRVVHNLWDPDELPSRLCELGWTIKILGPGLFGNIVWAQATR